MRLPPAHTLAQARRLKRCARARSDAEGRLVLADTLTYTQKYFAGVDTIFDFATLTGACVTALGSAYAGIWANDDDLAGAVTAAASSTADEQVWRMPWEDYSKELEHPSCDLKHTGAGPGGANSAAAFIEKFIDDDVACARPAAGLLWPGARSLLTGTVVVRRDALRHRRRQRHPGLAAGRERLGRADGASLGAWEPRRGVNMRGRVVFLGV